MVKLSSLRKLRGKYCFIVLQDNAQFHTILASIEDGSAIFKADGVEYAVRPSFIKEISVERKK